MRAPPPLPAEVSAAPPALRGRWQVTAGRGSSEGTFAPFLPADELGEDPAASLLRSPGRRRLPGPEGGREGGLRGRAVRLGPSGPR